ncbi:hypothetical protein MPSEU_000540600 [Mayamaea pseudoterrestris]|nr:hypothetical protein MPSEU_000540600 [Mayamaea pseudoterrestris]
MAIDLKDSSSPSCMARQRRSCRACCCLYGLIPVLLAPILTAALILSLYSSAGCDFIHVDIDFVPANSAWNSSSQLEIGLFMIQKPGFTLENDNRQRWLPGCTPYSKQFTEVFMSNDKTWKVSRIMAIIAAVGGGISTLLNWLMVLTPLPTNILWPGLLLPIVMLSFIAEGSKFLFFDVALCSNPLWFQTEGVESTPQQAKQCMLGLSGKYGVAASSLFLVALLMNCFLNPRKRHDDLDFDADYLPGDDHDLAHEQTDEEDFLRKSDDVEENDDETRNQAYDGFSEYDESVYTNGRDPSIISRKNSETSDDVERGAVQNNPPDGDVSATESIEGSETASTVDHISESRISKYQELARKTTWGDEKYIQSLVDDLDISLSDSYASSPPLGGTR